MKKIKNRYVILAGYGYRTGAVMLGYGLASILCPYLLDIAGLNTSFLIAGIACAAGLWGTRYF